MRILLIVCYVAGYLSVLARSGYDEPASYLNYVANKGQWEEQVLYRSQFKGGTVYLEKSAFTYLFFPKNFDLHAHAGDDAHGMPTFHAVRMEFAGAAAAPKIQPDGKQPFYHNYFSGKDPSKWASQVSIYRQITYKELYPGISIKTFSRGNNVRYDFVLQPGADPSLIQLRFTGQDRLSLRDGNLIISTAVGEIVQEAPYAYQMEGETPRKITCVYTLEDNTVRLRIADRYNTAKELIIDPTLVFATYSGSTADNFGMTATYDIAGNGYTAGVAFSHGYPTTPGAFQPGYTASPTLGNFMDMSISKFNPSGTALLFSTYLGGSSNDAPQSIVVDGNYNLVILGRTVSNNFPVTQGSYSTVKKSGWDITLSKLNSSGTALLASTFIGGSADDGVNITAGPTLSSLKNNYTDDARGAVLVDKSNNVYVASSTISSDFPVTPGCLQATKAGLQDGCVFKMNPSLSAFIFCTYLGASNQDAAYNIALDSYNSLYVAGGTLSPDFPITSGALHPFYLGGIDGYITHLSAGGNAIINSTFIGTSSYDQAYFVQTDRFNNVYVYGQCSGNFPITPGVYFNANSGQFIQELTPNLSTSIFSTEFGSGRGTPDIVPAAFLVDNCQNIYISGWGGPLVGNNASTSSTNGLFVTSDAFQPVTDGNDFYFMVLSKNAASVLYATFFGGSQSSEHVDGGTSRFDKTGIIYQSICESCGGHDDMPTTPGAWSSTNNSLNCNNALVKFKFDIRQTVAQLSTNPQTTTGCAPFTLNFVNNSVNAIHYQWFFGDGNTSTAFQPSYTYTTPGTYSVTLISTDSSTCNMVDTTYLTITVNGQAVLTSIPPIHICRGDSTTLNPGLPTGAYSYSWSPASSLSNATVPAPQAWPAADVCYTVTVHDSVCASDLIDTVRVFVHGSQTSIVMDPGFPCLDDTVRLSANASYSSYAWSTGQTTSAIRVTAAGLYTLTTVDSYGCPGSDTLRVGDYRHVLIAGYDTSACQGYPVPLLAPQGAYTYNWQPPAGLSDPTVYNPQATPSSNTIYTLTISNGPCLSSGSFSIIILPLPVLSVQPSSVLILPGESAQLNAQADSTVYWTPGYGLSCSTCLNPIASPDSSVLYIATTVNAAGCPRSDSVRVNVTPTFYVPNCFTPIGDGLNDLFRPVFSGYVELDVYIFNRWGDQIYHYNTLDGGWDGTYKGSKAEMGVYVYKIIAKDYLRKTIERVGSVTLLR